MLLCYRHERVVKVGYLWLLLLSITSCLVAEIIDPGSDIGGLTSQKFQTFLLVTDHGLQFVLHVDVSGELIRSVSS